jgi:hypothetical protein
MPGAAAATGVLAACLALAAGLAVVGAAAVRGQQVAAAADAAALAAADAVSGAVPGIPCERAALLAETAGATVTACETSGAIATVAVRAAFGMLPLTAVARAGPPPDDVSASPSRADGGGA